MHDVLLNIAFMPTDMPLANETTDKKAQIGILLRELDGEKKFQNQE